LYIQYSLPTARTRSPLATAFFTISCTSSTVFGLYVAFVLHSTAYSKLQSLFDSGRGQLLIGFCGNA
jgi:hypothetical protein